MATSERVTVDPADFDALLRRASFYTTTQPFGRPNPADVTIAKVEYDSLLRISREFELLKTALYQGGITSETLDLLIAGSSNAEARKDSGISVNTWADDGKGSMVTNDLRASQADWTVPSRRESNAATPKFNLAPGSGPYYPNQQSRQASLQNPTTQRQISYTATPSSVPEANGFDEQDEQDDLVDVGLHAQAGGPFYPANSSERRTVYFTGLSKDATCKDLLSIIKGGKIVSMAMRLERNAVVTFFEGAAEFLACAKRHDLYLHSKRVEVKWADREFRLNDHIRNRIVNGATRNIVVHNAARNGLTEAQIREDMEHIHNLVIVDITFRGVDAFVSTNSVHNALFARTCMLSRTSYKGCKIEFYRDECDTPLPARAYVPKATQKEPTRKAPLTNTFGCLNIDGSNNSSDEENRVPLGYDSDDDDTLDMTSNVGVSLNFLDDEN